MQERSVTRAAQRLNVSQSTISHALNRLRSVLKDELFIRGSGEMRPTPRAVALSTAVIPTLTHIRAALTQTQLSIPVEDGRMLLGTWQGVYLFEHRRVPSPREIVLHVVGE